jgi:diapolycopene oxygenase
VLKVAVIGGGLGGLATAARLARAGLEVTVFEQNPAVGGKAGELRLAGCRFDTGPSLLTMPQVVDDLFTDLGESRAAHLHLRPLDVLCRYQFADGTVLRSCSDAGAFGERLAAATTDTVETVARYMARSAVLYRLAADFFLFRPLAGWASFGRGIPPSKGLWALRQLPRLGFGQTMHGLHRRHFRDPRTVQLFDRYATYTGSDPHRCPATLALIPHVEHRLGACLVGGGVYRLVEAVRDLAVRQGANIQTGARVERIVTRQGQVRGITLAGEPLDFEAVVSAVDVNTTYRELLADRPCRTGTRHMRRPLSSSALVFYWAMRGEYPQLDIHNIFFSEDYRREFEELRHGACPVDPTVYLYRSCGYVPSDAPVGHENWHVMVNVPPDGGQDWRREVERMRARIFSRLGGALGLAPEEAIAAERVLAPPEIQSQTGSYRGSLYGPASHGVTATFLRQPNRSREIAGLYFCGGSAHPGGGMPLVMLSGALAAQQVLEDMAGGLS